MIKELDVINMLGTYELYEIWDGPHGEVQIQILFRVVGFELDTIIDAKNYAGEVTYEITSEFGGGTASISTTFAVVDNVLEIEEDLIDTDDLDWDEIDEEVSKVFSKKRELIN